MALAGSLSTGKYDLFGFGGGNLSAGPLAGVQAGDLLLKNGFGVYVEGHRGLAAGGFGFALTLCN